MMAPFHYNEPLDQQSVKADPTSRPVPWEQLFFVTPCRAMSRESLLYRGNSWDCMGLKRSQNLLEMSACFKNNLGIQMQRHAMHLGLLSSGGCETLDRS